MKPSGLLVCLLALGISCSKDPSTAKTPFVLPPEFIRLTTADPTNDFNKAIQAKDFRYIGLMGEGLYTPGISLASVPRNQINVVKGTSDAIKP